MTTTTARRVACPKCSGTGTVSRFLDYKGGVCFDCSGAGTVALVGPRRKNAAPIALTVDLAQVGLSVRAGGRDGAVQVITAIADLGLGVILITTDTGAQFMLDGARVPQADFLAVA